MHEPHLHLADHDDADDEPPPSLRPRDTAALPRLPGPAEVAALPLDEARRFLDIAYNPAALSVVAFGLDAGLYEACRAPIRLADLPARLADRGGEASREVSLEMAAQLSSGLGLLERRGDLLEITPMTRRLLLADSPLRLTGLLRRHQHYLREGMGRLTQAIAGARRSSPRAWTADASREEQTAHFAQRQSFNEGSMVYFADTALLLLLAHRDLDFGRHRVACDLGGGPGAFAGLLQRCHPSLRVRAVDISLSFPRYRVAAAAWLASHGCEVELIGKNLLHDPLPPEHDLVLVNRVISGVPQHAAEPWLRRIFDATAPGGRVAFADYFFTGDPAHDFNVTNLYVYWATSDWLAHEELARELEQEGPMSDLDPRAVWGWLPRWTTVALGDALRAVGFVDVRARAALSPFAVVEAARP